MFKYLILRPLRFSLLLFLVLYVYDYLQFKCTFDCKAVAESVVKAINR